MAARGRARTDPEAGAPGRQRLAAWMTLALAGLAIVRILYHASYLADDPFAVATFSDGRQYELAALDILQHPPLGSRPFYLQGLYAYFMAVPMMIRPWVGMALLAQLVLAGVVLVAFFAAVASWLGRRRAAVATMILMAYPMLAFYENKFLTAELAVATSVAVLWTLGRARTSPAPWRFGLVGVATGLLILARPNAVVAVPFVAWAIAGALGEDDARRARRRALGAATVGLVLALTPMAVRNLAVTGRATVFPAHGGGTSFYIGNNARARGVWNDAGGLLTGDVARERAELVDALGIPSGSEADESAAIGRALYRRGLAEIAEAPGRWLWLEVRKAWLMVGNDELTQDYDPQGERELLPFSPWFGIPFGVLVVGGLVGAWGLRRRIRASDAALRPLARALLGLTLAVVAGNLLFFTSAQHRLPLVVPLAVLVPFAIPIGVDAVRQRRWPAIAVVLAATATTFVPRIRVSGASAIHYYNLAVVYREIGEPREALAALDQAIALRPGHPVLRLERATVLVDLGEDAAALEDLRSIEDGGDVPAWIQGRVRGLRRRIPSAGASRRDGAGNRPGYRADPPDDR